MTERYPNRWKPGQSGNPIGRPLGTRNRAQFAEKYLGDVANTWHKYGGGILDRMAVEEPFRYADMCSRLVPRDVQVSLQARLPGGLEPEEWALVMEIMQAVRLALPDAGNSQPGQVLNYVLEAVKSYKLIENST